MKELADFIEEDRKRYDIEDNNKFAFTFYKIQRYWSFLNLIHSRYQDLTKDWELNREEFTNYFNNSTKESYENDFIKLQNGGKRKYIYYHCTKQYDYECPEPYIEEESLVEELIQYVTFLEKKNPKSINISAEVKKDIKKYSILRDTILTAQKLIPTPLTFTEYVKHVLYEGSVQEKQQTIKALGFPLYIHNKNIYSQPLQ